MVDSFQEEKYKLARNPFTGYRATRDDLKLWVNREKEIENWKRAIGESLSNPTNNYISFIIGDYGMGKSASIYKIEEICKEFKSVFAVAFGFLGEEKVKNPGINFIQRIFKFVDFSKITPKKQQIERLIIISEEARNIYFKIFFGNNEEKKLAIYFLRGQITPNKSQLERLGLLRKINDIETAKEYLQGFLYLLKMAGYDTLILMIDEFEYLQSLVPKSQRDIYFALLRGLYDLPLKISDEVTANMLFFLSISEHEFRKMEESKEIMGPVIPLMRRVYLKNRLTPLKEQNVRELVELRLKYNRVSKRFEKDPLIPYTEDFLKFIWKRTGGKPGDIILDCGQILDLGIKQRVTIIDKEFAIKALSGTNV